MCLCVVCKYIFVVYYIELHWSSTIRVLVLSTNKNKCFMCLLVIIMHYLIEDRQQHPLHLDLLVLLLFGTKRTLVLNQ
jgi:Ca2+/Na+ antiporter